LLFAKEEDGLTASALASWKLADRFLSNLCTASAEFCYFQDEKLEAKHISYERICSGLEFISDRSPKTRL
jgi:hypothetical protein